MSYKNILIISPEPWNGHFVSKHHYAINLAKSGAKVYFLDPPNNNLKDIVVQETEFKNLYCVQSPKVAKGLQYMPKFVRNFLEAKWLKRLEFIINDKIDTIWLFENSRFYDLDFAKDRLKIYHQVDFNQNFHIKEASKSADICFCISEYIRELIYPYNEKTFIIGHGVQLVDTDVLPDKYLLLVNKNKINVVYIGNLDMKYINEDIFINLIKKYPNAIFHLIGSYSESGKLYQKLKNFKNVVWWGRVESKYIIPILKLMDINLIIYKSDKYKKQITNTHKILEYLMSGKVIVSTYLEEYKNKRYLIEMVDNPEDFIKKFDEVVNNLDNYNSPQKQQERIEFALQHTYDKQLEKIKELIKKYTNKSL